MMKTCTKCNELKHTDSYHKSNKTKDGKRADCKDCVNEARRKRFEDNPEHSRAINKQSRQKPEFKAKRNEYKKQWLLDNPDKAALYTIKNATPNHIRAERNITRLFASLLKKRVGRLDRAKFYDDIKAKYKTKEAIKPEAWEFIKGYEELYKISSYGNVYSCRRDKVMNKITHKDGYKLVRLYMDNKCKLVRIHRLVADQFISNSENKPFVNHMDLDKTNNNVNNLEWATAYENNTHRIAMYL